jgi:hypothetical protein
VATNDYLLEQGEYPASVQPPSLLFNQESRSDLPARPTWKEDCVALFAYCRAGAGGPSTRGRSARLSSWIESWDRNTAKRTNVFVKRVIFGCVKNQTRVKCGQCGQVLEEIPTSRDTINTYVFQGIGVNVKDCQERENLGYLCMVHWFYGALVVCCPGYRGSWRTLQLWMASDLPTGVGLLGL